MNNKMIIAVVIGVVVIGGGIWLFMGGDDSSKKQTPLSDSPQMVIDDSIKMAKECMIEGADQYECEKRGREIEIRWQGFTKDMSDEEKIYWKNKTKKQMMKNFKIN